MRNMFLCSPLTFYFLRCSQGTGVLPRFRKPLFSTENSPSNMGIDEYKKLLESARIGISCSNTTVEEMACDKTE